MWRAKSSPYSKSNSSWPLFSAGQAVTKPLACRIAQDGGAELLVDQDAGLLLRHAAARRLEAVVDHLLGGGDLGGLSRRQRRLPAEQLRSGTSRGGRTAGCRAACRSRASSCRPLMLAIATDQGVGRAVVLELGLGRALQLGDDRAARAPCPVRRPTGRTNRCSRSALGEDAVLVERDQLAQRRRRQPSAGSCSTAGCLRTRGAAPASRACLRPSPASAVLPKASASACAKTSRSACRGGGRAG